MYFCAAGQYSITPTRCQYCADGFFSGEGQGACTLCPSGFASSDDRTICYACPAGKYETTTHMGAFTCKTCPVGYFSDNVSSASCRACPDGMEQNNYLTPTSCKVKNPTCSYDEIKTSIPVTCTKDVNCSTESFMFYNQITIKTVDRTWNKFGKYYMSNGSDAENVFHTERRNQIYMDAHSNMSWRTTIIHI